MKSSPREPLASGRPLEIEETANRLWVHPASRALVSRLIATPITPNQISVTSMLAAGAAAGSFVWLPRVAGALIGLGCLFIWHVLDGADGDLARRTNRASASGELVDGLCDHASQALIYVGLAAVLQRTAGLSAWAVALAAAMSHTLQSNAYEAGRKTYRHWVYGAAWMRQRPDLSRSWAGLFNRVYLRAANVFSPGENGVEVAMRNAAARGEAAGSAARQIYRDRQVVLVKRSGVLGSTGRSVAVVVSLLAGSPIWFFVYEIFVLNVALLIFVSWRRHANEAVTRSLSGLSPEL